MNATTWRETAGSRMAWGPSPPPPLSCAIQNFRFIVLAQNVESLGLRVCPRQHIGRWIITILTQFAACPLFRRGASPIRAIHLQRQTVQVVGREIRPEVRAVAVDRTVLHEAIGKERFLTGANVLAGEDRLPRLGDDSGGNRRAFPIDANREIPQDCKTKNEGEDNTLDPPGGELHFRGWRCSMNPPACALSRFSLSERIRLDNCTDWRQLSHR